MNANVMIFMLVCTAVFIVGAINTAYQIYKMVELDAAARELKHSKFLGFLAMNGNNSPGLLFYLIVRRKYPIIHMSEESRMEIEVRKKKAGVGLIFLAMGAIGVVVFISLM